MRTWNWPYELKIRESGAIRNGFLIRREFEPGLVGIADCHPWPELGDDPSLRQLECLREGVSTPLLRQSLRFAGIDAEARELGTNLFEGLRVPRSHASLPYCLTDARELTDEFDRLAAEGYRLVKVKVGTEFDSDLEPLVVLSRLVRDRDMEVRIDFNEKPSFGEVDRFMAELSSRADGLGWLDWIEDPCTFLAEHWSLLRERYQVRVALDRPYSAGRVMETDESCFDVLVLKPAVSGANAALAFAEERDVPIAVTSYLDHPMGQLTAAWVASSLAADEVRYIACGLVTHPVYEPNAFSEQLGVTDARLIPPPGTGFGFDELLNELSWEEVR